MSEYNSIVRKHDLYNSTVEKHDLYNSTVTKTVYATAKNNQYNCNCQKGTAKYNGEKQFIY